jgi:hypothetical protein
MFLLKAIPKRLSAVSAILNLGAREEEFKIAGIKKAVIAEWERLAKPKALAQRITAVKPHGKPPKFFQQQQPPPSTSKSQPQAPQTDQKKKRFGRGKNGKGKYKAKGHSHATLGDMSLPMAYPSFGFADPGVSQPILTQPPIDFNRLSLEHQDVSAQFVPQITIPLPQLRSEFRTQDPQPRPPPRASNSVIHINGNGATTRQVAENLPAQAHTSHPRPTLASFWPSFNQAREVCDRLELQKNQRNLRALETLALQKTDSQVLESITEVVPEKDDDMVSLGSTCEDEISRKRPNSEKDEGSPPKRVKPLSWADQVEAAIFADDTAEVDDDMISLSGEEVPLYDGSVHKAPLGLYSNLDAFGDEIDESMGPYDPRLEDEYQCESIMGRSVILPPHDLLLTSPDPQASVIYPPSDQGTCSIGVLFACISAESKYFAHRSICRKCQEERNHQDWILDSGASVHFTNCKEDFVYYKEMEDGPAVQTASDTINIEGCGTVYIQFKLRGRDSYLNFHPSTIFLK